MYKLQVKPRNYMKIAIIFGVICAAGAIFSIFMFEGIVTKILKWQFRLKPGYIYRKFYEKVPFPVTFNAYIWDILNKEEVSNGGKPHLKQVGPYVFQEVIIRHDTIDDNEEDTLEYTLQKTWKFKPELSNGLTGDEIVTTFHPVIASIALAVNVDRKPMLGLAATAINELFHNPTDAFWTGKVMDMLFNGIKIDCSSSDFNAKAVCSVFESGENAAIQPIDDETFVFSVLGGYNHTSNGRYKVFRGVKNLMDVARIIEVDEEPELDVWATDECNQFNGTDTFLFHPFIKTDELVWGFERIVCFSVGLEFERKRRYRGIPGRYFRQNLNSFSKDPCYCRSDDYCPIEGTIDLFPCLGVPLTGSLPHFLDADPSLLENVASGLSPDKTAHEIFINFEVTTGVPVHAFKRLQFNFELVPIPEIDVMANMPEMIFPWLWVEEGVKLPSLWLNLLKYTLIWGRRLNRLLKYCCFSVFPIMAIMSLTVHILIDKGEIEVIDDVHPVKQFALGNGLNNMTNTIKDIKEGKDANSHNNKDGGIL